MSSTRRLSRTLAALGLAGAVIAVPTAAAGQTPEEAGDYAGAAQSTLIDLQVIEQEMIPGGEAVDLQVAPGTAAALTTGGLEFDGEGGLTAAAEATNVRSELFGEAGLDEVPSIATQTAPPDNDEADSTSAGEIPDNPLLAGEFFPATALARDVATVRCPDDGIAARGASAFADLQVIPNPGEDSPLPVSPPGGDIAAVVGLPDEVSSESLVHLVGDDPSSLAVQGLAEATVSEVNLFGEAGQIDIAGPATLTATAPGRPGGASVDYSAPVVTVNGDGLTADDPVRITLGQDVVFDLPDDFEPPEGFTDLFEGTPLEDAAGALEDALGAGGDDSGETADPLSQFEDALSGQLPFLVAEVALGGVTQSDVADDGTSAQGAATLLTVDLLAVAAQDSPLEEAFQLLSLDLGPMSAEAVVAEGGVDCAEEAVEDTDVEADAEEPPPEAPSMPRTGGGLALFGLAALAGAGALRLAQRRR